MGKSWVDVALTRAKLGLATQRQPNHIYATYFEAIISLMGIDVFSQQSGTSDLEILIKDTTDGQGLNDPAS
jgi:hypothetical protein